VILLDAGPLVAASNVRDPRHDASLKALGSATERMALTPIIVAEVAYLLATQAHIKVEAAFLESLADGTFEVIDLVGDDYRRMAELVTTYADLPLDAGDASIVAIAERLGVSKLLTLDERDFNVVRPNHVDAFELVPIAR
jgi:predicted nucleic acid-binding protein